MRAPRTVTAPWLTAVPSSTGGRTQAASTSAFLAPRGAWGEDGRAAVADGGESRPRGASCAAAAVAKSRAAARATRIGSNLRRQAAARSAKPRPCWQCRARRDIGEGWVQPPGFFGGAKPPSTGAPSENRDTLGGGGGGAAACAGHRLASGMATTRPAASANGFTRNLVR